MTDQTPLPDEIVPSPQPETARPRWRMPVPWTWVGAAVAGGLVFAYLTGMAVAHKIDGDPEFGSGPVAAGHSRTVAVATALIHREVDLHGWTANDPFFMPSWALDDMPHFQQGIITALARFTAAVADENGLLRGPNGTDPELERAAGLLKYSGTTWMFDPRTAWSRTASSEKMYRNAMRSLDIYNERLAAGTAGFERRPAALAGMLSAVARDLGAGADTVGRHIEERHWALFDVQADDLFYAAKGRLYAYSLLLRELHADAAPVINSRELGPAWAHMVETFRAAARLDPLVVTNGAPDAALLPSHLASQGFLLERARAEAAQMADALRR
jgi:hypothetical protein